MMFNIFKKIILKISRFYWNLNLKFSDNSKLGNIIVFESAPDLSDNTKAVFDELLARKFNERYKLVYLLYDHQEKIKSDIKNVYYIPFWEPRARYYCNKAKVKISCNHFLEKNNDGQFCIYLSHGSPIKSVRKTYTVPEYFDYTVCQSQKIMELYSYEINYDSKRIVPLGYPRNDVFAKKKIEIRDILDTTCKKIIVWYPTFRQHRNVIYKTEKNALPIIHNADAAKRLNQAAKEQDVLLVLKPHFAQNLSYIKDLKLSNIRFINDEFFSKNNISSYQFVGACDALITDYSSIYYDYTLCDKPIAAIWEDIEEYKQSPGLVENYEYLMKGAEKVYILEELIGFLRRVANDVDVLRMEREEIRDYVNVSTDGKSSERVVNFIIEKAKLI